MNNAMLLLLSLLLSVLTLSRSQAEVYQVAPTVETVPVPHSGDRADDIAIWIHPTQPELSVVIGTDKEDPKGGLLVYDLAGKQIFFAADGKMNNVDVKYDFPASTGHIDLVAATNRTDDSIAIYKIDPETRSLVNVAARKILAGREEVYGICFYKSAVTGKYFVFINNKDGLVDQWELSAAANGLVDAVQVRSFAVGSIVEGIVADDELGVVYVGQEDVALWKYAAEPDQPADTAHRTRVDIVGTGGHLVADVEGLTIYYGPDKTGYLIASSQGEDFPSNALANTYAVYDRQGDNAFRMSFRIVDNPALNIDGVTNTDGIDVVNVSLGSAFPFGMFVVQDGTNPGANQNFKYIPWERIAELITPPLIIDCRWSPRALQCGAWGFLPVDLNRDCRVDVADLAMLSAEWLRCTDPADPERCASAL
jgi:3-phytase